MYICIVTIMKRPSAGLRMQLSIIYLETVVIDLMQIKKLYQLMIAKSLFDVVPECIAPVLVENNERW